MTTSAEAKEDLKNGYAKLIVELGTDFSLERKEGTTEVIRGHVVPMGKEDVAIINAIGVDAVFIHCLSIPPLLKFEKLTAPSGRKYSIEAVHEIYVNNVLVGQKVVAR